MQPPPSERAYRCSCGLFAGPAPGCHPPTVEEPTSSKRIRGMPAACASSLPEANPAEGAASDEALQFRPPWTCASPINCRATESSSQPIFGRGLAEGQSLGDGRCATSSAFGG